MTAPLASSMHNALIMSMLEYRPTPKVAAKKLSALTATDCMEPLTAAVTASFFYAPRLRSRLYLFVIRIA